MIDFSICLLATLHTNYWTDLTWKFWHRFICRQGISDYISQVIRIRIRIQDFFERSFNIAI